MASTALFTTKQATDFASGVGDVWRSWGSPTPGGGGSVKATSSPPNPLTFSGKCGTEPDMATWTAAWNAATPQQKAAVQAAWFTDRPFLPLSDGFLTQAFGGGGGCQVSGGFDTTLFNAVSNIMRSTVSTGPVYSGAPTDGGSVGDLGDQLRKVRDDFLATLENIARGTVTGAVTGARQTTAGANTGSGLGVAAQLLGPLLLIGVGVGVVLLIKHKG